MSHVLLLRVLSMMVLAMIPATTRAAKTNVLLICVDDLKPALACYGDSVAKSPNIDKLARNGVRMDRAYCNQAVCSPSRNALMTGLRPQTLGIYDLATNFRLSRPDATTMGTHFQAAGYETQSLGKIFHVGQGNRDDAASWSKPAWRPKGPSYASPNSLTNQKASATGPRGPAFESADVADNFYGDGKIADEAIARLESYAADSATPFFMAVGFLKPHLPFVAPKKYWDLYDPNDLPLPSIDGPPEAAPDFAKTTWGELRSYRDVPGSGPLDATQTRQLIHGYYAALSYTDAQIGRVIESLKATGLDKNTIVILWGDHGWHLGDHGQWCKHTNYEQATRIPLVVAGPGLATGNSNALVETVDVFPTLCEIAGIESPKDIDGRSFAATLRDPVREHRDHVVHVYPRGKRIGRSVRDERYRLTQWKEPNAEESTAIYELYDYKEDPLESLNLADDAQLSAVRDSLLTMLKTHPEAKPQINGSTGSNAAKQAKSNTRKPDRNAMFDRRDKNDDGMLSNEEFLLNQPDPNQAPARFIRFDRNGDGVLSRDEFVKPAP